MITTTKDAPVFTPGDVIGRVNELAEKTMKSGHRPTKLVVGSRVIHELARECTPPRMAVPDFLKHDASFVEEERRHWEHFSKLRAMVLRGDGSAHLDTVAGQVSVWVDHDGNAPDLIEFL